MNTKVLLAVFVALILSFFGGWVIWGIALMDFYQANTSEGFLALQKEEIDWVLMILAQIGWAVLLTWVLVKTGSTTAKKGAATAAILAGLITLSFDLFFHATAEMLTGLTVIVVDVLVNIAWGAVIGAAVGMILGRKSAVDMA